MIKAEDAASLAVSFRLLTGTEPLCEEKPVLNEADGR
jgi:hypothetical protein